VKLTERKDRLIDEKLLIAKGRELFVSRSCEVVVVVVVVVPVSKLIATSDTVALAEPPSCLSSPLD
jgi:hypothetical protein